MELLDVFKSYLEKKCYVEILLYEIFFIPASILHAYTEYFDNWGISAAL